MVEADTVEALCALIADLAVRGAPALGAAGAMGVALAHVRGEDRAAAAARLEATRPTAVNLAWGARRALAAEDPVAEALIVAADDVARCRAIGRHGADLVPVDGRVLTHCNAGGLACVGYGTAVGVIRGAQEAGRRPRVWVDETRPVLQGARLTAWELGRLGIEHTLVVDAVAGSLMADGLVDLVVVGADRIAANGDVANKIGTYSVALAAAAHSIPFVVAAPVSTVDLSCPDGAHIEIEERADAEVTNVGAVAVAPAGQIAANPAFDVTPAALVTAVVTEAGVARAPYESSLSELFT